MNEARLFPSKSEFFVTFLDELQPLWLNSRQKRETETAQPSQTKAPEIYKSHQLVHPRAQPPIFQITKMDKSPTRLSTSQSSAPLFPTSILYTKTHSYTPIKCVDSDPMNLLTYQLEVAAPKMWIPEARFPCHGPHR